MGIHKQCFIKIGVKASEFFSNFQFSIAECLQQKMSYDSDGLVHIWKCNHKNMLINDNVTLHM